MGYSAFEFGRMIGDSVRMGAYTRALEQAVTEGATVLDIGAGTGIFAFICCRLGARKVYAIEPNDAVHLGKELTGANGFDDQIEWIQKLSTEVELPEKVDVVVSDLRGVLPFFGLHIPSIIDARRRFLKPGGALIPMRDTLHAAITTDESGYKQKVEPWAGNDAGFNFNPYRGQLANCMSKDWASRDKLLSEGARWAVLDYSTITNPDAAGTVELEATRSGVAHGLYIWFDAELLSGIGFSGGPDAPEMVYGCAFFPWPEPVQLEQGDVATVDISANLVGGDYLWRWNTVIHRAGDQSPAPLRQWRQSTGDRLIPSPAELRKSIPTHIPTLNTQGILIDETLRQIRQNKSTGFILDWLTEAHAGMFPSRADAIQFLTEKVWQYTE